MVGNYHSGTDVGKEIANSLGIESAFLLNFPGVYDVNTYIEQLEFNVALLNHILNGGADPRLPKGGRNIGFNLIVPLIVATVGCVGLLIYKKRDALFQ